MRQTRFKRKYLDLPKYCLYLYQQTQKNTENMATIENTIGKIAIWGCDIIEICSITVDDCIMIKILHNNKMAKVNINQIQFI